LHLAPHMIGNLRHNARHLKTPLDPEALLVLEPPRACVSPCQSSRVDEPAVTRQLLRLLRTGIVTALEKAFGLKLLSDDPAQG
jgi:hypothetical protein